jgi:hypothetical protein
MKNSKWFKWTVEFQVHETWVEDGFDLTDERALDMLAHDLSYANIGTELKAKVLDAPSPMRIKKAQGYPVAEQKGDQHV